MKRRRLAVPDPADVGLVDVGPDLEAGEIQERHEGGRGEAGRHRLALLGRDRGHDAGDRRGDARVAELGARVLEVRLGLLPLLLRHRGGPLGQVQVARRDELRRGRARACAGGRPARSSSVARADARAAAAWPLRRPELAQCRARPGAGPRGPCRRSARRAAPPPRRTRAHLHLGSDHGLDDTGGLDARRRCRGAPPARPRGRPALLPPRRRRPSPQGEGPATTKAATRPQVSFFISKPLRGHLEYAPGSCLPYFGM